MESLSEFVSLSEIVGFGSDAKTLLGVDTSILEWYSIMPQPHDPRNMTTCYDALEFSLKHNFPLVSKQIIDLIMTFKYEFPRSISAMAMAHGQHDVALTYYQKYYSRHVSSSLFQEDFEHLLAAPAEFIKDFANIARAAYSDNDCYGHLKGLVFAIIHAANVDAANAIFPLFMKSYATGMALWEMYEEFNVANCYDFVIRDDIMQILENIMIEPSDDMIMM